MKPFVFNTTKSIINESGALKNIAEICRQNHMSKPLVVTDQGIVSVGLMAKLEDALKAGDMPYNSYADVKADPPEAVIYAALDVLKAGGNDGVIGFGGGSSMDTAKLVALTEDADCSLVMLLSYGLSLSTSSSMVIPLSVP